MTSIRVSPCNTGSNKRDIVFLLDGTDDSRMGLPAIQEFISQMAKDLDTNDDVVRMAIVQYSDDVRVYFSLKSSKSRKAVISTVRNLRHKGGRNRKTGAALQFVRDRVFRTSSGSRHLQGVPQILFLLTVGKSSDDVSKPALSLKQFGVQSFAIGFKRANLEELQKIAFSSSFLYKLTLFGQLVLIQPELAAFVQQITEHPVVLGKIYER